MGIMMWFVLDVKMGMRIYMLMRTRCMGEPVGMHDGA